jgi:hypothetical protein
VDRAERGVAVADGVDGDPDADEVVDVGEVAAAHDHLLVDRVVVLRPATDGRLDLRVLEVLAHRLDQLGQLGVARGRAVGDEPHDLVVPLGVEGGERQVLELPLDGVHAEPVRQRREDLQGDGRDPLLLLLTQVPQGAHVVQPVGELDDEHPRVAGHRHDHLADRLRLGGLAVLDLVELGDAVDEVRNVLAELLPDVLQRVRRVLDRVVQQRGREGRGVHAELGEDGGDRERVRDVQVPAAPALVAVHLLGDLVGADDVLGVGLGVAGPQRAQQRLEDRRRAARLGRRGEPGQPGPHATAGRRAATRGGLDGLPDAVVVVEVDLTRRRGRLRCLGRGCRRRFRVHAHLPRRLGAQSRR